MLRTVAGAWLSAALAAAILAGAIAAAAPSPAFGQEVPGIRGGDAWQPPPIAWQEPSPLPRLFLQLPFEAPEPLEGGRLRAEARLLYSNSIVVDQGADSAATFDVETAQLVLRLAGGLGHGLEAEAALPVVADWGGFLDQPIEAIEQALGASNPDRLGGPRNQATWSLQRADGSGFARSGPGAGLGDAWLALKARLLEAGEGRPALSLRLACSLPTGRLPWGAGAVVPAVGLLAGYRWRSLALRASLDLAVPTAPLRTLGLPTRPYATANVGLAIPAERALAVQVQGSAHGAPVHGTGLGKLDLPTYYLLLGLSSRLGDEVVLDAAVVENVWSPYRGADLTFVLAVHGR